MLEDMHGMLRRLKETETKILYLHKRIDQLKSKRTTRNNQPITTDNLTKLPNTLRNTTITITQLKETSAKIIAKQTNRTRGMENIYLNQLVRIGYLKKIKGRESTSERSKPYECYQNLRLVFSGNREKCS